VEVVAEGRLVEVVAGSAGDGDGAAHNTHTALEDGEGAVERISALNNHIAEAAEHAMVGAGRWHNGDVGGVGEQEAHVADGDNSHIQVVVGEGEGLPKFGGRVRSFGVEEAADG
jgi:hypothetical protein